MAEHTEMEHIVARYRSDPDAMVIDRHFKTKGTTETVVKKNSKVHLSYKRPTSEWEASKELWP